MRHSKCRALNRAPGSNPGLSARTNPFAYMIHIKQRDFYILCFIINRKYLWLDMIDFKSIYAFYIDYRTVVSYNDAVNFFFGIINEDFYYSKVDNIFELSYDQTIEYAKQNGFYDITMEKLQLLLEEPSPNESFYRSLI